MKRLTEKTVFCGLVTAWRLATVPTRRSPDWANATTDGVVRAPSAFSITVGSPPSRTAMHEFVVPRSMPMVFAMIAGVLLVGTDCEKSASCYSRSFVASPGKPGALAVLSRRKNMAGTPVGPGQGPSPHDPTTQMPPPQGQPLYAPAPPDQRFERGPGYDPYGHEGHDRGAEAAAFARRHIRTP